MVDPYRRLGLKGNPFVAEPRPGVAADVYCDRGVPQAPEAGRRMVVQLIGVRGAGKTTLMLKWQAERGGRYRHVPRNLLRWMPLPLGKLVYWDEADRAPRWLLRTQLFLARLIGATVVLGTHVDLGADVTHHFGALTTEDVRLWAAKHIERARTSGSALRLPPHVAADIAYASDGSWRTAGDLLHAWAADEVETNHNQ